MLGTWKTPEQHTGKVCPFSEHSGMVVRMVHGEAVDGLEACYEAVWPGGE